MKKFDFRFSILQTLMIVFFTIFLNGCKEDENIVTSPTAISADITGQWQMTITPLFHYIDTTNIKGNNGYDFKSDPSVNDEVYFYRANSVIDGFAGPIKFRGTITDSIRIGVYEPKNGRVGADTVTEKTAEMVLIQNAFGYLEGRARILLDRDTTGVIFDTYNISCKKIGNISELDFINAQKGINSWIDDLCKAAGDVMSFITSALTGGAFRPMANCWGNKAGGGFYVFGNEGPGSLLPVWTMTSYYPLEWAACKVRVYNFNINYDGQAMGMTELKDAVLAETFFLSKIGFFNDSIVVSALESFYNTYGNFAITIGYNLETQNIAVYVNNENGSTNAHTHFLAKTIIDALSLHFSSVYASSGRNISDSWHMRRSDFFVCNTSLLYCYVFGTAKVNYN